MLKKALYYRNEKGFSVIPIKPHKKFPTTIKSWKEFQERKPTNEEITKWWTDSPDANIGIITGKISNLAVVDFDKYDKLYSEDISLEYFPDSLETPTVTTPSGGIHLYFCYPEIDLRNNARRLPGIDLRAEGGYVLAPPSIFEGKRYKWLLEAGKALAEIPEKYLSLASKATFSGDTPVNDKSVHEKDIKKDVIASCGKLFTKGRRDQDIFHAANCLIKGGMQVELVEQILSILAQNCRPPFSASDTKIKITSALERSKRRERNLQAEVDSFISITSGYFSLIDCYGTLQAVSGKEKAAVRKALQRRTNKTIEQYGKKDGVYQRIDTDLSHIDFSEKQGAEFPIRLPLDLHEMVEICEGNIILVSGEYNAGKTSFALNVLAMNKNRMKIRYLSSEMKAGEFKRRWKTFPMNIDFWAPDQMTEYIALGNNIGGSILPDGLNILDYLEFREGDFTQGAEYMRQIHDKLTTGVAIVCCQQKEGARLPRSGDLILEKPRLAFALKKISTDNEITCGMAEIQKAKNVRLGKCDGKKIEFELREQGSVFHITKPWGYWRYGK